MGDVRVEVALQIGAKHPEGPRWDADTARLWWVDIEAHQVHCFDPESGEDRTWAVEGPPGGVVLDHAGRPVVATPRGLAHLDRRTGETTLHVPIEQDQPENRANDMTVDAHGRVWMGTMALDKRPQNGALYRVEDGEVLRVLSNLTISNGPGIDEPAHRLYLADTALYTVDVFDFDADEGALGQRRPFLDFAERKLWPDGMTIDAEGRLWVALGRGGAVHRYRPDGTLDGIVEVPTSNPTSVAFGGPDLATLFITTSWADLDPEARRSQPLAGAIFHCRPGVTGRSAYRYRSTVKA